jgi:hypothetical protein
MIVLKNRRFGLLWSSNLLSNLGKLVDDRRRASPRTR